MTSRRSFELVDFVLLSCQFSILVSEPEDEAETLPPADDVVAAEADEQVGFEVEGARHHIVSLEIDEEENEFIFVLETTVTDKGVPYELTVVTGSRLTVPDPPVGTTEAASTLLFITYPYVRELLYAVTSRSPYVGFRLPPLTKRPEWGEPADSE